MVFSRDSRLTIRWLRSVLGLLKIGDLLVEVGDLLVEVGVGLLKTENLSF